MRTADIAEGTSLAPESLSDRYRHIMFVPKTGLAASSPRSLLARRPTATAPKEARPSEEPLDLEARRFLQWVLKWTGVDLECYRGAPLARRLQACLRCLRARSIAEARQRLEREPERVAEAASALLIGVTQFFRDAEVFSHLDQVVLPKLSGAGTGLRIWSAGCADGAELYSVAMLLAERRLLEGSELLGTDCRADVIGQAQRGWFNHGYLELPGQRLLATHFVPRDGGWQVRHALRRATAWRQADALAGPAPGGGDWDMILCRNLAIYLEPAAAARLWTRLAESLRIGGVLVVGKAERPEQRLRLVRAAPCVYERVT